MDLSKERLLNSIASSAYNIGYGADKHFATHNIYSFVPNIVSLAALSVSIYQVTSLASGIPTDWNTRLSYIMIVIALIGFYVGLTGKNVEAYSQAGEDLTAEFNSLRRMYDNVLCATEVNIGERNLELEEIVNRAKEVAITRHPLFLSDWFAHVLFFGTRQSDWVSNELNLTFWKDMVPCTFKIVSAFIIFLVAVFWGAKLLFS